MELNPVTVIINLHKSEMENGGAAYNLVSTHIDGMKLRVV